MNDEVLFDQHKENQGQVLERDKLKRVAQTHMSSDDLVPHLNTKIILT